MQITVDNPDEFAAKAQARGLTPESYVRSLIDGVVRSNGSSGQREDKLGIKEFIRRFSANSERIPQLPDEAFTREIIYQDHV